MSLEVNSYEGTVRVRGWNLAYVLWTPKTPKNVLNNNSSNNNSSNNNNINNNLINKFPSDGYKTLSPISISSQYETIVCSHGWLDNANSFATIAPYLCNRLNTRVVALDLPGHGKSSHNSTGYYTKEDYAIAFLRFLHALEIHSFHFMGHSLSAALLPYILGLMKGKQWNVKSIICIEQFGAWRYKCDLKRVDLLRYLDNKNSLSGGYRLYNSLDEIVKARIYVTESKYPGKQSISINGARLIMKRNVNTLNVMDSQTREKSIKYFLRTDPVLRYGASGSIGFAWVMNGPEMLKNILWKISCPILCVFGKDGWPYLDQVAKMSINKMSNAMFIKIKGSHHLHLDDPKSFADKVIPFLKTVISGKVVNTQSKSSKL